MKLSIITITFNNFEDLVKTCASIPQKSNIEHIVINGGTCGRTIKFLSDNPHIHSISEKDQGISDAFNKGLNLSTGDGVWFLNSGDVLTDSNYPEFALKNIERCDFIHSDITIQLKENLVRQKPNLDAHLIWGMPCFHPTMIVHKSVFQKVGLFDLKYKIGMDLDFLARMKKAFLFKNIYYPHSTVIMDGSGVSNTSPLKSLKENKQIVQTHIGWTLKEKIEYLKVIRSLAINKSMNILKIEKPYAKFKNFYKALK